MPARHLAVVHLDAKGQPELVSWSDELLQRLSRDGVARLYGQHEEPIVELRYCEAQKLVLRADRLYHFTFDPKCESCMKLKRQHDAAYGDPDADRQPR